MPDTAAHTPTDRPTAPGPDLGALAQIARFGASARASLAVRHGETGYFAVTPNAPYDGSLSLADQARQLLAKADARLAEIGSGRDQLLFVAILLADVGEVAAFNAVWDAWIAGHPPPARACFGTSLTQAALKVELIIICRAAG